MLSSFGLTDQEAYEDHGDFYNYKELEGLGILNIGFCPHFNLMIEYYILKIWLRSIALMHML